MVGFFLVGKNLFYSLASTVLLSSELVFKSTSCQRGFPLLGSQAGAAHDFLGWWMDVSEQVKSWGKHELFYELPKQFPKAVFSGLELSDLTKS